VEQYIECRGRGWKLLSKAMQISETVCCHGGFEKNVSRDDQISASTSAVENDADTLCFSSFVFVDSRFLYLLGLLLVKPYRMEMTTMDYEGKIPIEGLMN
jgi:hypothetical protein